MELRLCFFSNCSWFRPKTWRTLAICFMALTALSTNAIGMQSSLFVMIDGTGAGAVNAYDQYGIFNTIHCVTGSTQGCAGSFTTGSLVSLYATPDSKSMFAGWSGKCNGQLVSPCSTLIGDFIENIVTATFNLKPLFKAGPASYFTMQNAFDSADDGTTIYGIDNTFTEDVILNRAITVTFDGGKSDDFNSTIGTSKINGSLTISNGTLVASNLEIS